MTIMRDMLPLLPLLLQALQVLQVRAIATLDLTGDAPELHDCFRMLVGAARELGVRVIDRCNLTVLSEPGQQDLAGFLAAQQVEVVASLRCYAPPNVDHQRGEGVFERSIAGLRQLNALGYGVPDSGLVLDLVFNPQGPSLPPLRPQLEADYRRELTLRHGVRFNRLLALANMPIQRFGSMLVTQGRFAGYMRLLRDNHVEANLEHVMCRSLLSVDWQGYLHDCDFNQQRGIGITGRARAHLVDLLDADPAGWPIAVAEHCYGCTAGQGSGCGGALT